MSLSSPIDPIPAFRSRYSIVPLWATTVTHDENLARAELSPAEEASHIARRKVVWANIETEAKKSEAVGGNSLPTNDDLRSDGRKKGPQHLPKFAADLASVTGESKRGVNAKIARATPKYGFAAGASSGPVSGVAASATA